MSINRRSFLAGAAATAGLALSARAQEAGGGKTYRACIIGDTNQGGYGHDFHLAFDLHDRIDVVALADPDEAGRAKHAEEAGVTTTYADYREMLEKEKPDIVAVGPRWTIHHKEYVEACAAAGAHGFLEKPLCVDLAEGDAMVAAVEAKNLKWAVAYNFRVTPTLEHVKKAIHDDKLIGTVVEMRARGKEDPRAGSEDLVVLGTHLFDMMRYLMGDPLWCQADITHNGKTALPEHVREASEPLGPMLGNRIHATFGFDEGRAGHFSSMRTRELNGGRWGLDVYGTNGVISIKLDPFSRKPPVKPTPETVRNAIIPEALWLDDSSWMARIGPDGAPLSAWRPLPEAPPIAVGDPSRERHALIVADLVEAIASDREPVASIRDSLKAQEMIQALFEAYVQGRRVTFPLEQRDHPLKRWA